MIEINFAITHLELLGYASSGLLALCGLPSMIISIKRGNTDHIHASLLIPWFLGEIGSLVYALQFESIPLNFNYIANIAILLPMCYYKVFRRKKNLQYSEATIEEPKGL